MKLDGKGIIIVNVNGTMNYIQYGNNKDTQGDARSPIWQTLLL